LRNSVEESARKRPVYRKTLKLRELTRDLTPIVEDPLQRTWKVSLKHAGLRISGDVETRLAYAFPERSDKPQQCPLGRGTILLEVRGEHQCRLNGIELSKSARAG
jgi:hypothetical protein